MYTILVMSRKGGSGKSTTSMNMAAKFANAGYKVSLMDLDPQQTLTKWYARREHNLAEENTISYVDVNQDSFVKEHTKLKKADCDVLIIDTPPTLEDFHKTLLKQADFTLIPVKTTMEDLETVKPVVDLIESADVSYGFMINETKNNTLLYLSIKDVLVEYGAVLGTVASTVQIPEASIKGLTLTEYKPDNVNCIQYEKVFKNLSRRVNNKRK